MTYSQKIISELNLNTIGWVEMLIALYPILSSYQYGPVPLSLFVLLLIIVFLLVKHNNLRLIDSKDIKRLAAFVVIHDFVLILFMGGVPVFFINSLISFIISFAGILFITPYVNWRKLEGSINWVAIICILGLIIQYLQVQSGKDVGMLKIPLLPESGLSRYHELYSRPHSFFEEPVMYSQFMLIPLFIALLRKKLLWAGIIALSVLMSSSTTGLILIFIQIVLFILLGKTSTRSKVVMLFLGGGLIWLLMNTDLFSMATNKLMRESEYTSVENVRLVQGPAVVSTMDNSEYVLGAPYANAFQYCAKKGILASVEVYGKGDDSMVYMTTFWQLILRFGILGLFLYLMSYLRLFKYKEMMPLLVCAIIMVYSASFWIGPFYVFYMIVLYSFAKQFKPYTNNVKQNSYNNLD